MGDKILRPINGGGYNFWCPGCKCVHHLDSRWRLVEGTLECPTIRPSVSVPAQYNKSESQEQLYIATDSKELLCHLHITNGKLEYLGGTTHELAGQTVHMVAF